MRNEKIDATFKEGTTLDYKHLIKDWNNLIDEERANTDQFSTEEIIEKARAISEIWRDENVLIAVFDAYNFNVLYFSENVSSFLGYSNEELLPWKPSFFFQNIAYSNIFFLWRIYSWLNDFTKSFPTGQDHARKTFYMCGGKAKHKNGQIIKTFIKQIEFNKSSSSLSRISILFVQNINHLVKSDHFWALLVGQNEQFKFEKFYTSKIFSNEKQLISPREMEVLKLIAEGKESAEIAKLLFVSISTVEKHRKNMIARSGAKDTTALIQICKMCNVL